MALGLLAGTLAVAFLYASAVLGMVVVISGQLVAILRNLFDAALLLLGLLGVGLLLVLVIRLFRR